jgi:hypothetical protein
MRFRIPLLRRIHLGADPRVGEARRLRALASGLSQAGHEASARQLCRKALRVLDPQGSDPSWSADAIEISRALDRHLASFGLRPWIARRRRRIAAAAAGVGLGFALVVAAVAPVRSALFPPDLAAGRAWRASSAFREWSLTGVLTGEPRDSCCLFHTADEESPTFTIDLGKRVRVHRVDVGNRADCCLDRSLPLVVEVSDDDQRSWTRVAYRRGEFRRWRAEFPDVAARFVRLRVDRRSSLHLRSVAVY